MHFPNFEFTLQYSQEWEQPRQHHPSYSSSGLLSWLPQTSSAWLYSACEKPPSEKALQTRQLVCWCFQPSQTTILQFIWAAIFATTDINCLALLMSARNHHLRWHCKQVRQFVSWCFQPSQTPIFQFIWAAIFAATGISCLALLSVPETTI